MSNVTPLPHSGGTNDPSVEDRVGVHATLQREALRLLSVQGARGMTWQEFSAFSMTDLHHGQATGVLSGLHRDGVIMRLADVRDRSKVYVLPEYVNDRRTETHGSKSEDPPMLLQAINLIRQTYGRECKEHRSRGAQRNTCLPCEAEWLLRWYQAGGRR